MGPYELQVISSIFDLPSALDLNVLEWLWRQTVHWNGKVCTVSRLCSWADKIFFMVRLMNE